jgi:hypothetical protein
VRAAPFVQVAISGWITFTVTSAHRWRFGQHLSGHHRRTLSSYATFPAFSSRFPLVRLPPRIVASHQCTTFGAPAFSGKAWEPEPSVAVAFVIG